MLLIWKQMGSFFESLRLPLAKGSSTFLTKPLFPQGREDVTAFRCSEPLRYKVGEPKRSTPYYAGWDRLAVMGISLQLYCWKWVHGGGRLSPPKLFLIAISLCTCRHSNEEYYFYSTFDRITSGEVPIRVMAEILWPPVTICSKMEQKSNALFAKTIKHVLLDPLSNIQLFFANHYMNIHIVTTSINANW